MAHICVVDDQAVVRESVAETLTRAEHRVATFADPLEALSTVGEAGYDLIITDMKMPKMDGLELTRRIRESRCDAAVIVMTAFGTVSSAVQAMRLGAFDFVQKPVDAESLSLQVDRALSHRRLQSENEAFRRSIDDWRRERVMIGDSEAMREIRSKIAQYGSSDATVLISGESGTGKELAAAAIHEASPRRSGPMLCLNCAALSSSLLESELFGHERGAFTGADRQRKGRFELAHSGTLLLDEISEMALPLQAKLLRVLQEGEFERVGSSMTLRSDVRVIATTNRNLEEWVSANRFRGDLFYRLNVLPLHLLPLRSRIDDIPVLIRHFLEISAGRRGGRKLDIEADAIETMQAYRWPGNIRELENVCQRAAVTVEGERVTRGDVERWLSRGPTADEPLGRLRPGRMLEDMERALIERTLRQFNGHRAKTARTLGMGVRTLGLKLKQWREEAAEHPVGRHVETRKVCAGLA